MIIFNLIPILNQLLT